MKAHNIISLIWFLVLIGLFLLLVKGILPAIFLYILALATVGWQGYFLGPAIWRKATRPAHNALRKYLNLITVLVLVSSYLLLLYGLLRVMFGL